MARIAVVPYAHTALDFDGGADLVSAPLDTKIHTIGRLWTLKTVIEPDSVTGTQTLISWNHAAGWPFKLQLDDAAVLLTVKYDDNTTATATGGTIGIGSIHAIMAIRRPSTASTANLEDIELWVDGVKVDSIDGVTKDHKLTAGGPIFAADTGPADLFNGTIDHATLMNTWTANQTYGWMRQPNPKAENVVYDYWMEEANATTNRCDDRSRYRNHATITSAPGSVTGLAVQTSPVSLLAQRIDTQSRTRLDIAAGGELFLVEEPF